MKRTTISDIEEEVIVSTARSGGPGGQHVNKVETKVILKWNVNDSNKLSEVQKEMIRAANRNKISKNGDLIVSSDSKRSQLRNKEIALKKLDRLLAKSFARKKARIPSTPTKASKKKRLEEKRRRGETKEMRKRII